MNLTYMKENQEEISGRQDVHCGCCSERQWAIFDKLFTVAYSKCTDCFDVGADLDKRLEDVFKIMTGLDEDEHDV